MCTTMKDKTVWMEWVVRMLVREAVE